MSAFKVCKTKIKDAKTLIACMEQVCPAWKGKIVSGKDLPVYGYHGDDRTQLPKTDKNHSPKAEIVLPGMKSKHGANILSGASNDLAFARNADGTLSLICSDYDSSHYGPQTSWWKQVQAIYNGEKLPETTAEAAQTMIASLTSQGKKVVNQGELMEINPPENVKQVIGEKAMAIPLTVKITTKMTKAQFAAIKANPALAGKVQKAFVLA